MACGVRMTSRPSLFGSLAGDFHGFRVTLRARRRRARPPDCRGSSAAAGILFRPRSCPSDNSASCAAAGDQRIGRQHAGAAGVRDDRQARSLRARLLGRALPPCRTVPQIVSTRNTPAAPERRIEHFIAAGRANRCATPRLWPRLGAAGLDDDDRLGQRHFARRGQKRARVADRFHVDDDALACWDRRRDDRSDRPSPRRASSRSKRTR